MAKITLRDLRKSYGDNVVVKQVNLEVADREFLVLLGPSGCGKSTVLRMIAGLESITDGEILIGDTVVNDLDPGERDIAMVFQNYALYPHMNARENIGFCLENLGVAAAERKKRVDEVAGILNLEELLERLPGELSGGQSQRVAIGRAIIREPNVMLMDEPLSNLDAKLRGQMRTEISKLHDRFKITTFYVTHDQVEAMTMADRIVIIEGGVIQQMGSPMEVYNRPINKFVAGFIGSPGMNFARVEPVDVGATRHLKGDGINVRLTEEIKHRLKGFSDRELIIGVRPQDLQAAAAEDAFFTGEVEVVEPYGAETYIDLQLGQGAFTARLAPDDSPVKGQTFRLKADVDKIYFFDPDTEVTIY